MCHANERLTVYLFGLDHHRLNITNIITSIRFGQAHLPGVMMRSRSPV